MPSSKTKDKRVTERVQEALIFFEKLRVPIDDIIEHEFVPTLQSKPSDYILGDADLKFLHETITSVPKDPIIIQTNF
ncbi:MAG: hypothetical protein AABX29_08095 [Nanoarchaeota archaeon]